MAADVPPSDHQTHPHQQSFIPKSQIFSGVLKNLYNQIETLIQNENFLINLNELLVTLSLLIKYTQFKRLSFGFLAEIISFLHGYLAHSDLSVRIKCVNAYCTLIQTAQLNLETYLSLNFNKYLPIDKSKFANILSNSNKSISKLNFEFQALFQINISPVTYFYNSNNTNTSDFNNAFSKLDSVKQEADLKLIPIAPSEAENDCLLVKLESMDLQSESLFRYITKSWLVEYCIQTISKSHGVNETAMRISCINLLCSLCKYYFYLIRESFDDIETILVKNLSLNHNDDSQCDQSARHDEVLATLKFFEELSRCMATRSLRTVSLDLNRCVGLWSNILQNSSLMKNYLLDERNYLLSSQACDCLASIGDDIFENLLINKRYLIITCLLNLTKSASSNLIRSASIRALGTTSLSIPKVRRIMTFFNI